MPEGLADTGAHRTDTPPPLLQKRKRPHPTGAAFSDTAAATRNTGEGWRDTCSPFAFLDSPVVR